MELHGREAEVGVHCAGVWAAREPPGGIEAGAGGQGVVFPSRDFAVASGNVHI